MWIFTSDVFLSVVENKYDSENLCVRARFQGDLEKVFPGAIVIHDIHSDYAFRTIVTRDAMKKVLLKTIDELDYTNFKDSVKDKRRVSGYMDVWSILKSMQDYAIKKVTAVYYVVQGDKNREVMERSKAIAEKRFIVSDDVDDLLQTMKPYGE